MWVRWANVLWVYGVVELLLWTGAAALLVTDEWSGRWRVGSCLIAEQTAAGHAVVSVS